MIEQLPQVLGSYRDGELEAVIIKNGSKYPVVYEVKAMDFEAVKDYLKNLNIETPKIKT